MLQTQHENGITFKHKDPHRLLFYMVRKKTSFEEIKFLAATKTKLMYHSKRC